MSDGTRRLLLPLLISLTALITLSYLGRSHVVGTYRTETDLYIRYAPDAKLIAAGEPPKSTLGPPGYAALLALAVRADVDMVRAGKWLSIGSAAVGAFLLFLIASRLFGYWAGVAAQLFVLTLPAFPTFALSAATDVPFLCLALGAIAAVVVGTGRPMSRVIVGGACAAVMWLLRGNGIFILPPFLLAIVVLNVFDRGVRDRARLAAVFLVMVAVCLAPYWYFNYRWHGSPFFTTAYVIISEGYYPDLTDGSFGEDAGRRGLQLFHSFADVIRFNPSRFVQTYIQHFGADLGRSFGGGLVHPVIAWLALAGLAAAAIRRPARAAWILPVAALCLFGVNALSHWEPRYFFVVAAVYASFAGYALASILPLVQRAGWTPPRALAVVPAAIAVALAVDAARLVRPHLGAFLANEPTEVVEACRSLQVLQAHAQRPLRIVSRKPHVPYLCGGEWVFFPSVKSMDELGAWLKDHDVDVITSSQAENIVRPDLAFLLNPPAVPAWLEVVWPQAPRLVLYRPVRSELR